MRREMLNPLCISSSRGPYWRRLGRSLSRPFNLGCSSRPWTPPLSRWVTEIALEGFCECRLARLMVSPQAQGGLGLYCCTSHLPPIPYQSLSSCSSSHKWTDWVIFELPLSITGTDAYYRIFKRQTETWNCFSAIDSVSFHISNMYSGQGSWSFRFHSAIKWLHLHHGYPATQIHLHGLFA